jgi:hypothetical protein
VEGYASPAKRGIPCLVTVGLCRQTAEQYERTPGDPELAFGVVVDRLFQHPRCVQSQCDACIGWPDGGVAEGMDAGPGGHPVT